MNALTVSPKSIAPSGAGICCTLVHLDIKWLVLHNKGSKLSNHSSQYFGRVSVYNKKKLLHFTFDLPLLTIHQDFLQV